MWFDRWNTARSVMIMSTTFLPVTGSVHSGMNLGSPFFETCSITTMIFLTPATRSIAPPMPLIILPGTIQLARSPFSATSMPPSTARSIWPPRIMPNEGRAVEKGRMRDLADRLLAGIDQVGIFLAGPGERADAEHAVLALQGHGHTL